QNAGFRLATRPARSIGNHKEIVALSICFDHAFQSSHPASCRGAAHRTHAEPLNHPRDNLAITMNTVHNTRLLATVGERHQQGPSMPERHNDLFLTLPTGKEVLLADETLTGSFCKHPQGAQRQRRPTANL